MIIFIKFSTAYFGPIVCVMVKYFGVYKIKDNWQNIAFYKCYGVLLSAEEAEKTGDYQHDLFVCQTTKKTPV